MGINLLNYTGKQLIPAYNAEDAIPVSVNFAPGLTIQQGQIVAQLSGAAANDVQTLDFGGSVTGGTFTLSLTGVDGQTHSTAALAYNISNANLKIAIEGLLEAAGYHLATVTITGGACPTDTVLTFGGSLAAYPAPLLVVTSALTGTYPTIAVVHTTTGNPLGLYVGYDGTKVADPTEAPTLTAVAGSTPSFVAGSHAVAYTFLTAGGETRPSPAAEVEESDGSTPLLGIQVDAIVLPTGATGVNYYVNGMLAGTSDGSQTTLNGFTGAAVPAPTVNAAFVYADGRQVAVGVAPASFRTDPLGRVIYGNVPMLPPFLSNDLSVPCYVTGFFFTKDLSGLDAAAAATLGRLVSGTLADGVIFVR